MPLDDGLIMSLEYINESRNYLALSIMYKYDYIFSFDKKKLFT